MKTKQKFDSPITQTKGGYPVKGLFAKPNEGIVVGFVKDDTDIWICVIWDRYGRPIKKNEGRSELTIEL